MILFSKDSMLNIKVYVVTLISVQFNILAIQYSSIRYGRPKGNCNLNSLEFGISRNIYEKTILGKRKIHSTFLIFMERKESSYTNFMESVPLGSDLHKTLIKLDTQVALLGYSDDLIFILSDFEFLKLSWRFVEVRNKHLYLKKDCRLLRSQFEIWACHFSKLVKSGQLSFDFSVLRKVEFGRLSFNKSKFLFGDLVIFQSLYILLMLVFDRFSTNSLESLDLSCGNSLFYIRNNFNAVNWFISGNLVFNKEAFMLTISKRVKDQSLKDLLYKYLKLVVLEGSLDLKDHCWYENKILSAIILNIYFSLCPAAVDQYPLESIVTRLIYLKTRNRMILVTLPKAAYALKT